MRKHEQNTLPIGTSARLWLVRQNQRWRFFAVRYASLCEIHPKGAEKMNADQPDPLTSQDCDLRDFPFMPLDVVRVRDSDIAAMATGDEFRCALLLWCASWHQVPAASLPDNDVVLAQLAGFGRVVKEWMKVKDGALRGWLKCSDGRLYHPVVAEKANEAWKSRVEYRQKKEADRKRKSEERDRKKSQENGGRTPDNSKTGEVCPPDKLQMSGGQTQDIEHMSRGSPEENALIGTVDSGQWIVNHKQDLSSLNGLGQGAGKSDDDFASDWAQWREFFQDECGVTIDASNLHDRKKFMPLATAWLTARVTFGQMRAAIAKARAEARETIAYLPGYADRVLASMTTPPMSPDKTGRHTDISQTNFQEGVSEDGRF